MSKRSLVLLVFPFTLLLFSTAYNQERNDVERLYQLIQHRMDELEKKLTDLTFMQLSQGKIQYQKIRYTSSADGLVIPAYLFKPLKIKEGNKYPALLFIHGGVHGDLTDNYFPIIEEFCNRGYIILGPEYRGSTGYGKAFYDLIDYGGKEVDDCISGIDYLKNMCPEVDINRVGIIGWSHGGFITLHAIFRAPEKFKVAVEIVGVADLVSRMGYKNDLYRKIFAEQQGFGGPANEKLEIYKERSPAYQAHKLKTPLLIHATDNDDDVNILETINLINALKAAGKEFEYEIYKNPPGGHAFNRIDTPQAKDSLNKIYKFLDKYLRP
ncbi:MAG: alpha/beta hydrolase family protein [Candidatus Aminicenantia bacterium]